MYFLANENFPLLSIRLLREMNYDISSIIENSPGIPDSEVLSRAATENQIILTFDRDYGELIYRLKLPTPRGVIYLRFQPRNPKEPADILSNLLQTQELVLEGKFTVVDRDQIRQRALP